LTGLGVGVNHLQDSRLLTLAALQLPFHVTNESKRQKMMEFVAVVFGLLLAWRYHLRDFHYSLHGDSMSSLAWARVHRVNSLLARRANLVFTTLSMHLNATLADTEHIPGKLNVIFDGLSRHEPPQELGLDLTLMFPAETDASIVQFIAFCDPANELTDMSSHVDLLRACTQLLLN